MITSKHCKFMIVIIKSARELFLSLCSQPAAASVNCNPSHIPLAGPPSDKCRQLASARATLKLASSICVQCVDVYCISSFQNQQKNQKSLRGTQSWRLLSGSQDTWVFWKFFSQLVEFWPIPPYSKRYKHLNIGPLVGFPKLFACFPFSVFF